MEVYQWYDGRTDLRNVSANVFYMRDGVVHLIGERLGKLDTSAYARVETLYKAMRGAPQRWQHIERDMTGEYFGIYAVQGPVITLAEAMRQQMFDVNEVFDRTGSIISAMHTVGIAHLGITAETLLVVETTGDLLLTDLTHSCVMRLCEPVRSDTHPAHTEGLVPLASTVTRLKQEDMRMAGLAMLQVLYPGTKMVASRILDRMSIRGLVTLTAPNREPEGSGGVSQLPKGYVQAALDELKLNYPGGAPALSKALESTKLAITGVDLPPAGILERFRPQDEVVLERVDVAEPVIGRTGKLLVVIVAAVLMAILYFTLTATNPPEPEPARPVSGQKRHYQEQNYNWQVYNGLGSDVRTEIRYCENLISDDICSTKFKSALIDNHPDHCSRGNADECNDVSRHLVICKKQKHKLCKK